MSRNVGKLSGRSLQLVFDDSIDDLESNRLVEGNRGSVNRVRADDRRRHAVLAHLREAAEQNCLAQPQALVLRTRAYRLELGDARLLVEPDERPRAHVAVRRY